MLHSMEAIHFAEGRIHMMFGVIHKGLPLKSGKEIWL